MKTETITSAKPTENQILLEDLLAKHKITEEKRIADRWDRIWAEYITYCRINGIYAKSFSDWAKTSKYSLNDKL